MILIPFYLFCCGSINSTPDLTEGLIELEISQIVSLIQRDLIHNKSVNQNLFKNISFKFLPTEEEITLERIHNMDYVAHCHVEFPMVEKTIFISEDFWRNNNENIKYLVLLHEVGHCLYGFKGNLDRNTADKCPLDIMNDEIDLKNRKDFNCLNNKYNQYKQQFFDLVSGGE
jgi:hypothetical protein